MRLENVDDFYPLSPLQEGMLFHSLSTPESGMYFNQVIATLRGDFNVSAFKRAWQRVVDRHPVLRSFCAWEGLKAPIQVVAGQVKLPFTQHDWRGMPRVEQQRQLEFIGQAEQEQGFDLSKAPLMRLMLIQVADDHYEFIWSFHHILLDGWSMFRVFKEVFALFEAFSKGQELHLEHPRAFRDYIAWLQQQNLSRAEAFWRKTLKGFTVPTPLAVDRALGGTASEEKDIDTQPLQLSAATTMALQSLSQQHHLTLNTLVQGAWALLLSRYSGKADVVYGSVVSGRPPTMAGVESMLGLFINTLPVRVKVSPDASLLDCLRRLQAQQVELREYEYSPLVEVQGWSDVPPGMSLFESILLFENYPKDVPLEEMGESLEIQNVRWVERVNYPLVALAVQGRQLLLRIIYHCSRFEAATITRMLGHWRTLLESMVADPQCRLSDLPMLTAAERNQLLVEWNGTFTDYPQSKCVHELFEEQVERAPEAVAVVCEGKQLTYLELNRRANQLAHYLRALKVGPEVLVNICMPRSLEMVVGVLGVLKAGGAYVPLDPANPKERLAFMLEDTRAPVLLTQERWLAQLSAPRSQVGLEPSLGPDKVRRRASPEHSRKMVCLDTDWQLIAQQSEVNPVSEVTPDNLAYVIYTSGSTGRPKGVAVPHRGLRNLVLWHQRAFAVTPSDRATQVATPAFDASAWELWPYLATGASVHLASPESLTAPEQIRDWLVSTGITISFLPTPLAEHVLSLDWPEEPALRILLTGGDKLHHAPTASLPFGVVNNYGPTENTVVTTSGPVISNGRTGIAPPIGRPIANIKVYLLDKHLEPVPVGVPGELCIGGDGLARGYLNRPELTADKFIPNPFSDMRGARLYKTGDLARHLPDGNIEFLGRVDHQMKIRGFRVELGEIETVLSQHPAVRETVVQSWEETPQDKHLVAYVVPNGQNDVTQNFHSELRGFLQQKLPGYMVPSAFVMLDALPLTPNGKVDRESLPSPKGLYPPLDAAYVAPQTEIEQSIAAVWQEVLHMDKVGAHDNFFDLGGHSLRMMQVHSKLRGVLTKDISIIEMFRYPTVSSLAKYFSQEQQEIPTLRADHTRVEVYRESMKRRRQRRQNQK